MGMIGNVCERGLACAPDGMRARCEGNPGLGCDEFVRLSAEKNGDVGEMGPISPVSVNVRGVELTEPEDRNFVYPPVRSMKESGDSVPSFGLS